MYPAERPSSRLICFSDLPVRGKLTDSFPDEGFIHSKISPQMSILNCKKMSGSRKYLNTEKRLLKIFDWKDVEIFIPGRQFDMTGNIRYNNA